MTIVAIHKARTVTGLPLEPVGIWIIDGLDASAFYTPEREKYASRARKALMERPVASLEEWVIYKAHSSPNWELFDHGLLFDFGSPDAAAIYDEVHAEYRALVDQIHSHAPHADRSAPVAGDADAAAMGWGASRIAVAQSWWIASELVRRHPDLMVYEMHPGGGQYDVLCVAMPDQFSPNPRHQGPRVMLNRVGTIQVHTGEEAAVVVSDWSGALEVPNPHTVIKRLESVTGWGAPPSAPATTEKSLVYRFFASALTMLLNDRHQWDVRNEFLDSSDYASPRGLIDKFPAAIADSVGIPRLGIHGEPQSHYWALLRGNQTVAMVSMEGRVYFAGTTPRDLMADYDKAGRRLIPMTTELLNPWL
ncbi:TY-Chap2 family putative peptide chaperone [Microbacterium sp. CPCC 204701]|uniref:TY-Chap2 family putative peptide chaperone n=1 Tax=Microbacterium sp. CPCC 204701 TaxID=2493084 RepID=UPI000FDBA346|nr:hypothetical protein [Microbacterium sp. CPCC 204701]